MSDLDLLQTLYDYRVELLLWVFCSILVYAVAVNLLHYLRTRPKTRIGRLLASLESWPHNLWVVEGLRFLYYLGIPYLALTRGVVSPNLMGLWDPGWFQPTWFGQLALGMTLGLAALLLLLWGWRHFLLASAQIDQDQPEAPYPLQRRLLVAPWGWGLIVLEILYLEMHWAFYRSATLRLLDPYYGVFAGLAIVLAELCLNPEVRRDLGMPRRKGEALTTMTTAFVVSIIYYFTVNLWLCMAVHLFIQLGLLSFLEVSPKLLDHKRQQD
jgi:hypothetical protein